MLPFVLPAAICIAAEQILQDMKKLKCDRCRVELGLRDKEEFTAGYYDVRKGDWSRFSHKGEKYICDKCMWTDPRYIEVYGDALAKSVSNE